MARERDSGRQDGLEEHVVKIRRCAAVVKGGLRLPITKRGESVLCHEVVGEPCRSGADPLLAFSVHAPSKGEAYWKQVNKLLDEIKKVAAGREVVIGGDFNLTVSHWPGPERPTCKQDLAIQARLAEEFGLLNCWQAANPDQLAPFTTQTPVAIMVVNVNCVYCWSVAVLTLQAKPCVVETNMSGE